MNAQKATADSEVRKGFIIKDREQLQKEILFLTEQKTNNKFSDKSLDREREKIELINGRILDLNEIEKVLSHKIRDYEIRFYSEYYFQIYRLNGWKIPSSGIISTKPNIVGRWTKEIIYNRFGLETIPALEILNPYITAGFRAYKHHQFLNDRGLEILARFIDEATDLMKKCSNWYEFRIKLYKKFNVPYQTEINYN